MPSRRFIILSALLFAVAGPASGQTELRQAYRQQWGEREASARSADERHALATELVAAAETESDKALAVYLCDQAYGIAKRDRANFAVAARALDQMKRIDPQTRADALEKLAFLYDQAYRNAPQQVLFGLGHADVLEELAEERVDTVAFQLDEGKFDPRAANELIGKAMADLALADRGLRRVVPTVKRYVELARTQAPDRLADFQAMADRAKAAQQRVRDRQAELRAQRAVWTKLAGYMVSFDRTPTPDLARTIALMVAADLDRPDAIPASVTESLTDDDRSMIVDSFRSPEQLASHDLFALGDWYARSAPELSTESGRVVAMSRATFYFRQADRKGESKAAARLADTEAQLTTLAGKEGAADALAELAARLAYVAPPTEPEQPEVNETTEPDAEPEDPDRQVATVDEPDQPNDGPDEATEGQTVSAESAGTVGGRPMVECTECGRRFFPGWGVTDVTKCPRCERGRENIFDFGDD